MLVLLISEWLFLVTKPSMFSVMGWGEKSAVLAASLLPVVLVAVGLTILLALLGKIWPPRSSRLRVVAALSALLPALFLVATTLLLVENFTMTVLGFNMGSFRSPVRYAYGGGCVLLFLLYAHRLRRLLVSDTLARWRRLSAIALVAVLSVGAIAAGYRHRAVRQVGEVTRDSTRKLPNILILSSDGVPADRMSVYGYERETTPFLDSRAAEFLISENHFTNAAWTAGSTGALLTGKLPTTTGVTQQFNVFQGRDVYEHLPGILRQLGYYCFEIGERHYADSHDQNLRLGFHASNSRKLTAGTFAAIGWYGTRYPAEHHYLASTGERIRERVAHAFGIADMPEPILALSRQQPEWTSDELRIAALKKEISATAQPFFAHVHLLDTHWPVRVRRPFFSAQGPQTESWVSDTLDDAVMGFDRYIREITDYLEEIGELDETILIVNTDHGTIHGAGTPDPGDRSAKEPLWSRQRTSSRLPLLIRFPHAENSGRIAANTQRIDLAPTLLSVLGVTVPEWMEGTNLLEPDLDPSRAIFSAGWAYSKSRFDLALIQCQRWLRLNAHSGIMEEITIAGHTDPCPPDELMSVEEGRHRIVATLEESPHFVPPLLLAATLPSLRHDNDPAARRRIARAVRDGLTVSRRLDEEMIVAWAHWDFWTYGVVPAALVVVNDGDRPLARRLQVHSGTDRAFPFSFHIEDGEKTHDLTFTRPGSLTITLASVTPDSERLFIIWSDQSFTVKRRQLGVKLALSPADRLDKLVRQPDAARRDSLAREILEQEGDRGWLAEDLRVAGVYWDSWSRGSEPAAVVVQNRGGESLERRLEVRSGDGREFPFRFYVEDGVSIREYTFERPGSRIVKLSPVLPGSERLFVLWTDQPWRPSSADKRLLGVQLAPAKPAAPGEGM